MIMISSVGNPYLAILRRNQEYSTIFKINIIKKCTAVTITISMALIFQSYWALILGHLVSNATGSVLSYIFVNYRPSLSIGKMKEQWAFSKWVLAKGILGYSRGSMDTFFVSSFYSPSFLGGFHLSKYISSMPASEGLDPALEPLLATFSKTVNDKEEIKHQINLVVLIMLGCTVPMSCFLYMFSEQVVELLLGRNWLEFSTVFGLLAFLSISAGIGKVGSHVLTASGKVKYLFWYDLYTLLFMGGVLFSFSMYSIETFTFARVCVDLLAVLALFIFATRKILGMQLMNILGLLLLYVIGAFSLAYITQYFFVDAIPVFLSLTIVGCIYLIFCIFLGWMFFKLFLGNNKAAHHALFILNDAKNKALARVERLRE
jgi:O-antigen/teichoic acid export membrane protein